jgi:putative oxidoreductase
MVRLVQGLIAIVGRTLIVAIFILAAVGSHLANYTETLKHMEEQQVPYPYILLPGALVFMIVGGVMVLIGYKARLGALLLLIFLGMASYYFHAFWKLPDGATKEAQTIHFFKNVSMMGAMIFLIGNGAGPGSVDAAIRRATEAKG